MASLKEDFVVFWKLEVRPARLQFLLDMQIVRSELSSCPLRDYAADYVGRASKARRTPSGSRAITVR